ncbi:hypothetical protein [Vannielia litorea]|uniref:hypothetical protein n=1 Tax=Vannielia litorea TaxID=1217970 RepID=UPI001C96BB3F|nr:hypothetical protein [Vannielia litorea]MBY6048728.1 hypothetical protein [Vannielia litorea]MBY6076142.1 hypothetical protein [Vannielia litorea]
MTKWVTENGEEWGPWVLHDGKGCPLKAGVIVDVVAQDRFGYNMRTVTTVQGGAYSSWDWEYFPELKKVIRYREKKPKGLQMLESEVDKLTEPKDKFHTHRPKAPAEPV